MAAERKRWLKTAQQRRVAAESTYTQQSPSPIDKSLLQSSVRHRCDPARVSHHFPPCHRVRVGPKRSFPCGKDKRSSALPESPTTAPPGAPSLQVRHSRGRILLQSHGRITNQARPRWVRMPRRTGGYETKRKEDALQEGYPAQLPLALRRAVAWRPGLVRGLDGALGEIPTATFLQQKANPNFSADAEKYKLRNIFLCSQVV
ncbi:hypothetical protein EDC01DRAFT_442252 [Geopyxis carbonaria]|nr:hypothetical protein EDC01DRAFT_442252 [Geopyxis carbonaria]